MENLGLYTASLFVFMEQTHAYKQIFSYELFKKQVFILIIDNIFIFRPKIWISNKFSYLFTDIPPFNIKFNWLS